MLLSNMKMTLKTILRDSTTAFAALIAVIMNFMYGLGDYARVDQLDVHSAPGVTQTFNYAMNVMLEMFSKPVSEIAFPFLGVIIAVNQIVRDHLPEIEPSEGRLSDLHNIVSV